MTICHMQMQISSRRPTLRAGSACKRLGTGAEARERERELSNAPLSISISLAVSVSASLAFALACEPLALSACRAVCLD